MTKEKFVKLISQAKEDKEGRLYIDGKYDNKIYFGTITTICEDIFDEHGCEGDEIYDRHWWGDDTLQCYIIKNEKSKELEKETIKNNNELFNYINDEMISYEELVNLNKNQKEYIKELEKQLYGVCLCGDKESAASKQPTVQELEFQLEKKNEIISALLESLRISQMRFIDEINRAESYRRELYEKSDK